MNLLLMIMDEVSLDHQGVGSPKNPNVPLLMTSEPEQAMALDRSGSDILTLDPFTRVWDSR